MISFTRRHGYVLIIGLVCTLYFVYVLRFYIAPYYAFDFSQYSEIAQTSFAIYQHFVPHDGFSSLFLKLASYSAVMPQTLHLLILLAQTIGIFALLYCIPKLLGLRTLSKVYMVAFLFSAGCFYYLYGKLFYDFPLTVASFGLSVFCFWQYSKTQSRFKILWLYLFAFAIGFCLSWKLYNVFLIAGFLGLLLCHSRTRHWLFANDRIDPLSHVVTTSVVGVAVWLAWKQPMLLKIITSVALIIVVTGWSRFGRWVQCLFYVVVGYYLGNFTIFYNQEATMRGIRAYPAHSDPLTFFFRTDHWIIWDHVNALPFNSSGLLLLSVGAMFVVTILLKKWNYLALLSALTTLFIVFIKFLSPGYPWHGFTFALFLVLYFIFILKELEGSASGALKKWSVVGMGAVIVIQVIYNHLVYVPTQIHWQQATQTSINILNQHQTEIVQTVDQLKATTAGTVYVDNAVKRQLPKAGELAPGYYRIDSLVTTQAQFQAWYGNPFAQYVIYIEPDPFRELTDVADIHKYDTQVPLTTIVGEGYQIKLYQSDYAMVEDR